MLTQITIILVAYLLGCIAVGYYLVRWQTGKDLHEIGSGATGGRNTARALGKTGAVITAIGDVLKGMVAVWIAVWFNSAPWVVALAIVAVLLGHIYPVQLKFKGGKGLSAAFGAVLVYDYRIALLTALLAGAFSLISRRVTLSFLSAVFCAWLIALYLGKSWEIAAALFACAAIIIFAHRENIKEALNSGKK
jgi:glycerol-3-phosphate acyltransferase PlsY